MTRPIRITTGRSRLSRRVERKKVTWAGLAKRLTTYETIDRRYEDYLREPVDVQADLKDVGFFVGGHFSGKKRLQADMVCRSVITLDIDHIDSWDIEAIDDAYEKYAFVVHSTAKHSEDTPRLRLVLPLAKDVKPDQYEPIARHVANLLGMDCFDDTTFQPARIMYWPSVTIDGDIYKKVNEGEFIDGQAILDQYDDWRDFGEWPHSSRISKLRKPTKQAEDPLSKAGVVGAFCRTFDIHKAITDFDLPYEPTDFDNRYRPEGSTGAAGAIVYDDVFLYSHHETDAAAQQNLNAFDLVRLHRFSELAGRESDDMPMGSRPSYNAMSQLAVSYPAVNEELHTSPDEMDAYEDPAPAQRLNGKDHTPPASMLTFLELRRAINGIPNLVDTNAETACDNMIPQIAAAKLDPQETDRLAGMLKEFYPDPKPSKKSVLDSIKTAGKRLTGQSATDGELRDTDAMIVQRVLDEHYEGGRTIKRVGKKFWTYGEGMWRITPDEAVDGVMLKTFIKLREERPQDELELVATIEEGRTSAWLSSLSRMFAAHLAARENVEDPLQLMRRYPLPVINARNCEIYVSRDGEVDVRESNPDNFFTHRIDATYKPKAKCPEWDRFNQLIWSETSDPADMQRHLEELGGYMIGMSRWLKTWVLFHGSKDAGKSTVTDVFRQLLGNAYLAQDFTLQFGHQKSTFAEGDLIGKLAIVDDDYDHNHSLPDGFLKKISEEKTMTAQIKYGDSVQIVSRTIPIILANHWPVARDVSDAFRERAMVLHFNHRIRGAERDDNRRLAMMEEMPGILNKFIAGLVRLRKRGHWKYPLDVVEAGRKWEANANPIIGFFHEMMRREEGAQELTTEVYAAYESWFKSGHGGVRYMLSRQKFFERLEHLTLGRKPIGGRREVFLGYRLLPMVNADELDDEDDDWDDDSDGWDD